jgi:hypothetical protein
MIDYSPPIDRRAIINALFDFLISGCNASFIADSNTGDPILGNVSSFINLRRGAPVFGTGIAAGSEILALDPVGGTITLDTPATTGGAGLSLFAGFQTVGRRLRAWAQVTALPALFVRHIGGDYVERSATSATSFITPGGLPPHVYIDVEIWLYSIAGADGIPEDAVDALIDIVEAALRPRPYGTAQTLGGLVRDCWMSGKYTVEPGDLDGQAKAVLPVRLFVPGVSPPGVAIP